MRFNFHFSLVAILFSGVALAGDALPPPTTQPTPEQAALLAEMATPEAQMKLWLGMIRRNDFTPLATVIPEKEWAMVERGWKIQLAKQGPKADAELDQQLALLRTPGAVDAIMIKLQPELAKLNPVALATQLRGLSGWLTPLAQQGDPASRKLDVAGLQSWVGDVADWLPKSGLNDKAKTRKAMESAVACVQALEVANVQQLRQIHLRDMLPRFGKALAAFKEMLRPYDLNLDALLDSVKIIKMAGEGGRRTMTVTYNTFGKQRQMDIDLVRRGTTWEVLGGQGAPFGQLGALIDPMMSMVGMGTAKPVPATPPEERPPGTL